MPRAIDTVSVASACIAPGCMRRSRSNTRPRADIVATLGSSCGDSVVLVVGRVSAKHAAKSMSITTPLCAFHAVSGDSSWAQVRSDWLLGAFDAPQKRNDNQHAVLPVTKPAVAGLAITAVARHTVVFRAISAMDLIAHK